MPNTSCVLCSDWFCAITFPVFQCNAVSLPVSWQCRHFIRPHENLGLFWNGEKTKWMFQCSWSAVSPKHPTAWCIFSLEMNEIWLLVWQATLNKVSFPVQVVSSRDKRSAASPQCGANPNETGTPGLSLWYELPGTKTMLEPKLIFSLRLAGIRNWTWEVSVFLPIVYLAELRMLLHWCHHLLDLLLQLWNEGIFTQCNEQFVLKGPLPLRSQVTIFYPRERNLCWNHLHNDNFHHRRKMQDIGMSFGKHENQSCFGNISVGIHHGLIWDNPHCVVMRKVSCARWRWCASNCFRNRSYITSCRSAFPTPPWTVITVTSAASSRKKFTGNFYVVPGFSGATKVLSPSIAPSHRLE